MRNFFFYRINKNNNKIEQNKFSIFDINLETNISPIMNHNQNLFLLYLIIKNIIENITILDINFSAKIFLKLQIFFNKNKYCIYDIFSELLQIIIENKLIINNIIIFFMAESPRFNQNNINYKNLIKQKILDIFLKYLPQNIDIKNIVGNISVHAGSGELIGKVGRNEAIDIHLITHVSRIENSYLIGYGFDRHSVIKLTDNQDIRNKNILGGNEFYLPEYKIIKAYSDGDIIFHSICNAIFSSLGKNDIGDFFSDKNKENHNKNSSDFLNFASNLLKNKNLKIKTLEVCLIANMNTFHILKMQNIERKIKKSLFQHIDVEYIEFTFHIPRNNSAIRRFEGIECKTYLSLKNLNK